MFIASILAALIAASPPSGEAPAGESSAAESATANEGEGEDAPEFSRPIELTRGPGEDRSATDIRAPGLRLRAFGGLERFSAVSLRAGSETALALDGAPLRPGAWGLVDLSRVPVDLLERGRAYRVAVPVGYGPAALGGVVDFVPELHRGPARLSLSAGFGSFRTRELGVDFAGAVRPRLSLRARAGYRGSRGDFLYFDNGGTPLLLGDDGYRRRLDNHYDQAFAQLGLVHRRGPVHVSSQIHALGRAQGIPGTGDARPSGASQETLVLRNVSRVRRDLALAPGARVEWVASLAGELRRFRDPQGEVGGAPDDERAASVDAWISPRLRVPLWARSWLTTSADLRGEWIEIDEAIDPLAAPPTLASSGDATRSRFIAGFGAELEQRLWERRLVFVLGARVDLAASAFAVEAGEGEIDDAGSDSTVLGFSPRFATGVLLTEGLELRGGVGRYLRFPSFFELFGDRGYLRGNEGLEPESGTRMEGELVFDRERIGRSAIGLFARVGGFVSWSRDRIQWARDGAELRPHNIDAAALRGLELGASLRAFAGDLRVDGRYVLLDSRSGSADSFRRGRPLPGLPRHHLLLRPAGGHRFAPRGRLRLALEPRVFYAFEWVAQNPVDLDGRFGVPARLLHGLGLALRLADRVELSVEGRNLGDARRGDFVPATGWPGAQPAALADEFGYPLAGRSFWAKLRFDLALGAGRER